MLMILIAFATTSIAWAQPALTPESPLIPPANGPAPYSQSAPSVASDGDGFFVAWEDGRAGIGTSVVAGTRLDRDGNPLDANGLILSGAIDAAGFAHSPQVVWTGRSYQVFWSDQRGLMRANVARGGEMSAGTGLQADGSLYGVAQIGGRSAVLSDHGTTHSVLIVDSDGQLLTTVDLPPVAAEDVELPPQITSDGSDFVVATFIRRAGCSCIDLRLVTLRTDGTIVSTVRAATSLEDGFYALGASADRVYVTSRVVQSKYTLHVFDRNAAQIASIALSPAANELSVAAPVVSVGDSVVVTWADGANGKRIVAESFDRDGTPQALTTVAAGDRIKAPPAVARTATGRMIAVWSEAGLAEPDIATAVFDPVAASVLSGPTLESLAPPAQQSPAVAFNGSEYLVTWIEQRGTDQGRRIVAVRASSAGVTLDRTPLVVSDLVSSLDYVGNAPAVASNGTDFVVLWHAHNTLLYRRIDSEGAWIDDAPRLLSDHAAQISRNPIVWNGREYFIVYPGSEEGSPLLGITIAANGQPGAEFSIYTAAGAARATVAIVGGEYRVVWMKFIPPPCSYEICGRGDFDIVGMRVAFNGAVLDSQPVQFSTPYIAGTPSDGAGAPQIAANGDSALVVWRTSSEWRAARWSSSGDVIPSAETGGASLLPIPSTTIDDVALGFDGRAFRLLHSAQPWGEASWTLYDVPAYGSLTLTNETLVARGATDREAYQGAMRVTSNGGVFLTYPLYDPGAGSVSRLFVRTEPGRARTRPTKR